MITFIPNDTRSTFIYPIISIKDRIKNPSLYKEDALKVIEDMVALAKSASTKGLMDLDQQIVRKDCFILRDGAEMVRDAVISEVIHSVFENYLFYSELSEKEFLLNSIMAQGILMIQQGEDLYTIKKVLTSMLGIEVSEDIFANTGFSDWLI